jgi:hypothetical protein
MRDMIQHLSRRLTADAEAVCRHYLSKGRREGRYWLVGDVDNNPGRSLYVRLRGTDAGPGAAGRWTDAATGEHGDLIDLIAASGRFTSWRDTLDEARYFLGLPQPKVAERRTIEPAPAGSPQSARRLWAMSRAIGGTVAETYLRGRGITSAHHTGALRFHPRCYYRQDEHAPIETRPALIAAVTDLDGAITGVQRTWLSRRGAAKAPMLTPRRAMGALYGYGVRFGAAGDVMAAGEGIETMLSLRSATPALPLVAALSANHLAALILPASLRRLYIVLDNDAAGRRATEALAARAQLGGVETIVLTSTLGDWNDDLRGLGASALPDGVRGQLAPEDVARFWRPGATGEAQRGGERPVGIGDRQGGPPA